MVEHQTDLVLLDTGPLVALLSANDQAHQACHDVLATLRRPPVTCWPVLTEAAWLLRHDDNAVARLLTSVTSGVFEVAPLAPSAGAWMAALLLATATRDRTWPTWR